MTVLGLTTVGTANAAQGAFAFKFPTAVHVAAAFTSHIRGCPALTCATDGIRLTLGIGVATALWIQTTPYLGFTILGITPACACPFTHLAGQTIHIPIATRFTGSWMTRTIQTDLTHGTNPKWAAVIDGFIGVLWGNRRVLLNGRIVPSRIG